MAAFQTYNEKHRSKNVVMRVEILQLCRYIITVITRHYLNARERERESFQSTEKKSVNAYLLLP